MNRKNHWRAKLMARMARDGDVESLAEMITELMETPDPSMTAPAVPAVPATAAPTAPVEVTTPADQPVLVDCGPDILAALNRIIELLTALHVADCSDPARQAGQADCTDPARQTDTDPAAEETAGASAGASAGTNAPASVETDPAAAQAVEADAEVAEVTEAVIGALGMEAEASTEGDPVEELVAEILETADPAPASPVEEAVQAEILSAVLEPDTAGDEETGGTAGSSGNPGNPVNPDEEDPEAAENAVRTADALRTALAAFRPQLRHMSPQDRQRFNADVAARMRKLTARSVKDRNPYAAIRGAAARPRDDQALGQKIMAARNVNRKN